MLCGCYVTACISVLLMQTNVFTNNDRLKMDLLLAYGSDCNSSEDNVTEDDEGAISERTEIEPRTVRQVYLITYSQADNTRFPTRRAFVDAVLFSFSDAPAKVIQWCCCMEKHGNSGIHYHMAIKLDKNQRWLQSKNILLQDFGISVHFSAVHINYYSVWRYVTKEDASYIESVDHPDLSNEYGPKTAMASVARRRKKRISSACQLNEVSDEDADSECEESDESTNIKTVPKKKIRKKRLTSFELSEIIVAKKIKSRTELLALARNQKKEGKTDIAEFIVNRGAKVVAEILDTAWEMETSNIDLERARKTRLDLLADARQGECVENCDGQWLSCAREVLRRNGIDERYFTQSVYELLEKGRGKFRNIMIVGVANCGKTFILNPLNVIYNTFSNPASTSFAWVGAEKAEIIFLNDFRWSQAIIPWHDLLLLLEGQLVHLPAPKSHYAKDIVFNQDTPIFATGKNPIVFVKNSVLDEKETEMMSVRWKVFRFHSQIPKEEQKDIPPCGRCFATLILCQ